MGWDTQINILVENIDDDEQEIARHLFESDARTYYHNGTSFIIRNNSYEKPGKNDQKLH